MRARMTSWGLTLLACLSAPACGPAPARSDAGPGCTGVCSSDGGSDGGVIVIEPGEDAGTSMGADSGMLTSLAQLRLLAPMGQHVRVERVVVHSAGRTSQANCQSGSTRAEFWVEDPRDPDAGFFVSKLCSDPPYGYLPDAGDLLSVDGYLVASPIETRHAYRPFLGDATPLAGSPRLSLTVLGTAPVPPPRVVDAGGFGGADGGFAQPDPEAAGTFVHVRGPLAITNATPAPLLKLKTQGGSLVPDGWAGFEVTGGILVVDNRTSPECDWRAAADGGATVVFPGGISGAWDTYALVPTCTPFPQCALNGFVPGARDGGYTYALYPTSCGRDLDGGVLP